LEQKPVTGSQVPGTWHWSTAVQTTASPPTQNPFKHKAPTLQLLPSLQGVPFGANGKSHKPLIHVGLWEKHWPAGWQSAVPGRGAARCHARRSFGNGFAVEVPAGSKLIVTERRVWKGKVPAETMYSTFPSYPGGICRARVLEGPAAGKLVELPVRNLTDAPKAKGAEAP
jgi:hypothetical protein